MGLYVNTNISSLNARRALNKTTSSMSRSFARLASGLRINTAKDDAKSKCEEADDTAETPAKCVWSTGEQGSAELRLHRLGCYRYARCSKFGRTSPWTGFTKDWYGPGPGGVRQICWKLKYYCKYC